MVRTYVYETVIAQDARCCAVTQEGRYCRRQPDRPEGDCWSLGLPSFVQFCSLHLSGYIEVRNSWLEEQNAALVNLRIARQLKAADAHAKASTVYYVQRIDDLVKIGYTGRDLRYRLSNLRGDHGPLKVLATHKGGRAAEKAQHARFAALRVFGEWFRPEPALLAHIAHINSRRVSGGMPEGGTWPISADSSSISTDP